MVGASGHILFEAMKLAGVPSKPCHCTYGEDRFNCLTCRGTGRDFSESVYVYNLVQCRPPGNDFTAVAEHYEEVSRCQSKYVAPAPDGAITFLVGGKALEYYFPGYTSIEVWMGSLLLNDSLQRFVPVVHPAYIMRVPTLTMTLANAIHEGIKRKRPFLPVPGRIQGSPKTLFVDIETKISTDGPIVLIGAGDGKVVEHFDPENAADRLRFQSLMDGAVNIVAHNAIFDCFKLMDAGFNVDPEKWFCSMLLWHLYQPDLPKGLDDMAKFCLSAESCYWKGLGREDQATWLRHCIEQWARRAPDNCGFSSLEWFYNAIDVAVMAACWWLIVADIKREGRWNYFVNDVMPCGRAYWEIERGGMRIDLDALHKWQEVLLQRVQDATAKLTTNPLVVEALGRRQGISNQQLAAIQKQHDEFLVAANAPREVARVEFEAGLTALRAKRDALKRNSEERKAVSAEIEAYPKAHRLPRLVRRSPYSDDLSDARKWDAKAGTLKLAGPQRLWLLYEGLKLPKQYAERKLKYGRKTKTLSANKDCLDRILGLWTVTEDKKAVVKLMKDVVHWDHWYNTFASIEVQPNGYIYPRIQIRTATGRAASGEDEDEKGGDSPTNAQNWPKEMRNVVLPDVGHEITQADYDQQEWLIQLWESGDRQGFANALAGESRHVKGACAIYGRPMAFYDQRDQDTDEGRIAYEEYKKAKSGNYGLAYGMGPDKFALQFGIGVGLKRWARRAAAEEFITKLKSAYPLVTRWQDQTVLPFAKANKYLQTKFGWRRYLYRMEPTKALAFVPSATGAGMMHRALPQLRRMVKEYGSRARLLTATHDSFAISHDPAIREEIRARMKAILQQPVPEMDGFSCPVTVKTGPNWKAVA